MQKCKRQELIQVGDFNSRIGKTGHPNEILGRFGDVANNKNAEEMLKFLNHNEMKT